MWNVGGRFMRSFQYILFLCIGLFLLSSCGNKNTEDQIGATQGSDHDGVVTQDQDSDFESFDFKDKISTISAAPSDSLKIVADSSNHLYAIGVINMGEGGASTSHGMIWKSMDEGKNWDIFQDFFPVGTRFNQLSDILLVDDQTLYVVGNIDYRRWIVRKSMDRGKSWAIVDDFIEGEFSKAFKIRKDNDGNLFVAGTMMDTSGTIEHTLIRMSNNQGATWQTIKDFTYQDFRSTHLVGFEIDPKNGYLYMGCNAQAKRPGVAPGVDDYKWLVLRSVDSGQNWQIVDDFKTVSSERVTLRGLKIDQQGYVYAVGNVSEINNSKREGYWIVRKSIDQGESFSMVDRVLDANPNYINIDSKNRVFVVGEGNFEGANENLWMTRLSEDGGMIWKMIDRARGSNKLRRSSNYGVYIDSKDQIYFPGVVVYSDGIQRKIIRKLKW